ncbi:U-box domain-containing protein 43 [Forsythia ovata]|uniref:RING-type E3 ubiquitin transferase n=1 Tax=Forsythia ovata TaxID=205694 RepID=A0ABD1XAW0_9LAMI
MASDVVVDASPSVASDILLVTAQFIFETVDATRQVVVQKENFEKFSSHLERTAFFLKELSTCEINFFERLHGTVDDLKLEIKVAKQLASECRNRNKIYLFLNCRKIVDDIEKSTKNISKLMSLFTLGSLDVSSEVIEQLRILCKNMLDAEYQPAAVEEEILQKIERGIEERNVDRSHANNLLVRIAESVGISSELSEIKAEFENFKHEMENNELRSDGTEALRMEQIILLLGKADMVTTPKEKETKYFKKRNSLGRQLLEPLRSFYCPITGDVMVDPVETSSGHSFERTAIEKWLEKGNDLCPLTKTPLKKISLRPNRTLHQSIEEWRNRNTMISIASMKPDIQSSNEQEVLNCLEKLHDFCIGSELHREWIVMEDYIPIITGLLCTKSHEIRLLALTILYCLAKDADDNKERIAKVDDGIKYIVQLLARKIEESTMALKLLLELSRSSAVMNFIGNVQGCMLLLVTLANSDDTQAAKYAQEVLDNLAFLDQNVIQMARAKYFGPLLNCLCTGPMSTQMIMADTLADMELTDHNKLDLFRNGALKPLLQLLVHESEEYKAVAVKALNNLSSVTQNGLQMIREGATHPLFELLFCHTLSFPKLREWVAITIMHLARSITVQEASEDRVSFLNTEDVFKLFSLISLSGPSMQQTILCTFHAICKSPSCFDIRTTLRQISAVKVLVQLCELDDHDVRAHAVKLFHDLTEDGDHRTFLEHVNTRCIETLVRIIRTSRDEDEIAAAMGIISNLPRDFQMSQQLLDSGAVEVIFDCLTCRNTHASYKKEVIENAAHALSRFTVSTNPEWQKKVAERGTILVLVSLLASGTSLTKQNVAVSLKQFSESSSNLSMPMKNMGPFSCCFKQPETNCPVHRGICTVESSFCLLEANAVKPLVVVLGEQDSGACEASLDAISTLIDGEKLQNGVKVLEEANAFLPIIKLLNSSCTRLQEKSLEVLQRIFRLAEFKQKYGNSAQMSLVDITQRGTSNAKSLAAKILAQLNVLHEQSSFF